MFKRVILIIIGLVLSTLIVLFNPLAQSENYFERFHTNYKSWIAQDIYSYQDEAITAYKIYDDGNLIGVISDWDYFQERIEDEYKANYETNFPDTSLAFTSDVLVSQEQVFYSFENVDEEIFNYILKKQLLGVVVTKVEFSTEQGTYDVIYTESPEVFEEALDNFLLNFISEDSLNKIRDNVSVGELSDYGTLETNIAIAETITYNQVAIQSEEIYDYEQVYEYLCYGRSTEREYYTVQAGDTLQGVGYRFNDMSASQIRMLNPDVILSDDQVLEEGMSLNVTYYTSPISVVVTRENLSAESIYPDLPQYIEDSNLFTTESVIVTNEKNGSKNVLREEIWINGVLQQGENVISSVVTQEPTRAVIKVGSKPLPNIGTGYFIWPIDNIKVSCHYGCYYGHVGTDFVNPYNSYGNIYAADNGTVVTVARTEMGGNTLIIDHNNGYMTRYCHMNTEAYVSVGETVTRGQVVGQIGNTGFSTGPHLHFEIFVDGARVNACTILDCASIPGG